MKQGIKLLFANGLLGPVRLSSTFWPQAVWPPLEWLSVQGARVVARALQAALGAPVHPLAHVMAVVHEVESLLGIEGEWELKDEDHAVRTVHHCPYASRLGQTTEFCTRLGQRMGDGLVLQLLDSPDARFEIVRTQSQGSPVCEYHLTTGKAAAGG